MAVAVRFIEVPITVLDTFVPTVVVLFNLSASSVLIPYLVLELNYKQL